MADAPLAGPAETPDADPESGTAAEGTSGATAAAAEPTSAPAEPEPFVPPDQLPAELKPHFKRMQASYTKRMQELASRRDDLALVDRFRTDPAFARSLIQQEATRLGLPLASGSPASPGQGAPPSSPSRAGIAARLDQSLAWLGDALDPAIKEYVIEAVQQAVTPLKQDVETRRRAEREAEEARARQRLSDRYPGWEGDEVLMQRIGTFLASGETFSPEFSLSRLEMLYALATGGAAAVAEATERMAQAGKRRTPTGPSSRAATPNIDEQIRTAKTDREADELAAAYAKRELEKAGVRLPA